MNLVKRIPKGKVTTYGEIARELTGSVRAARAVGQAVANNPNPISIPCHRVVRSNGDVGGYSLGVDAKLRLLREEGIAIQGKRVVNFEHTLFRFKEETPRFVTDRMLGKLSTWLRILGHDTLYAADIATHDRNEGADEDTAIANIAKDESRILLTRDKNLVISARKKGVRVLYIKSDEVMEQLKELLRHKLPINLEPVPLRCSDCNARIRKVKESESDNLKGESYVPTHMLGQWDFWICERCGKIYWEGSHWSDMRERLSRLHAHKESEV